MKEEVSESTLHSSHPAVCMAQIPRDSDRTAGPWNPDKKKPDPSHCRHVGWVRKHLQYPDGPQILLKEDTHGAIGLGLKLLTLRSLTGAKVQWFWLDRNDNMGLLGSGCPTLWLFANEKHSWRRFLAEHILKRAVQVMTRRKSCGVGAVTYIHCQQAH